MASSRVRDTYSSGGKDVLSEEDALGLDNEEVDELVNVADHGIERFTGNRVVLAGSQLGGQTLVEDGLSGNFGKNRNAQGHPCELEAVSQEIEVSSHKDHRDDASVGDSRGTCQIDTVRLVEVPTQGLIAGAGVMTYEGCSTTAARRRRSGSVSRAGRWQRAGEAFGARRRGWRVLRWSSQTDP